MLLLSIQDSKEKKFVANLLNELLGCGFSPSRLLRIPHLETCEVERAVMSGYHPGDGTVSIPATDIVVSTCQLACMATVPVPPVDPRDLGVLNYYAVVLDDIIKMHYVY